MGILIYFGSHGKLEWKRYPRRAVTKKGTKWAVLRERLAVSELILKDEVYAVGPCD